MKIKRTSWRYKLYKRFFIESDLYSISVCHFWWNMVVGIPFCLLLLATFYPFIWLGMRVAGWAKKRGTYCPLGKVEVEE